MARGKPRAAARKTSPSHGATRGTPRLAFFFGAGAEVSYGMPMGGRFALEIIRRAAEPVDQFKEQRERVNAGCNAAYRAWLPDDLMKQRITSFGKGERSKIFEDSLKNGYGRVISNLNDYDIAAKAFLKRHSITEAQVKALYATVSGGHTFGETPYASVSINESITRDFPALFRSKYFSALVRVGELGDSRFIDLGRAILQFYLGAYGQGAVYTMTTDPLRNTPANNPVFAELGRIFDINPLDAGELAFEAVMNANVGAAVDASVPELFLLLATSVLESTVEQFLDYRAIVDALVPALYRPRDSWSKFTKISIFLLATRAYVLAQQDAARGSGRGYYEELADAVSARRVELTRVATSNYTDLAGSALAAVHTKRVLAVNGSLDEYLDPYKNELLGPDAVPHTSRFLVPFLFTQSGVKPLTSVEVSRRYVEFYDAVAGSDAAVIVGFGFHGDDGHINALFRQAIDKEARRLIVLYYTGSAAFDESQARAEIATLLRIERADLITPLPIDSARRVNGQEWLDAVLNIA